MLLIRERPAVMIMAIVLLFVSANLDALGILLMAYPFATIPEGSGSVELLLGDSEFRTTVGLCFGGAILMFFAGATTVVWSMKLTVSTGRRVALSIGNKLVALIKSEDVVEIALLEQALLKHGGIEKLFRRAIRSLVRASFLLPRMISFFLTAMVGLAAILWLDPMFGLFATIGLLVITLPLYLMNKGVLAKVPVMERTMRRSQLEIGKLISDGSTTNQIFEDKGDFSNSLSIMGHLMTVRYRAAIIRSVFMSVCLIAVGAYLFMFESIDLGLIVPLLLALKLFAGSLQGIMRMSTGVSRTLVDATPATIMQTNGRSISQSKPAAPYMVCVENGLFELKANNPCTIFATGVSPAIALAMTIARVVDASQEPVPCETFRTTEDGLTCTDGEGNASSITLTFEKEDADLFVNRKAITTQPKETTKTPTTKPSDIEEELELELDMS